MLQGFVKVSCAIIERDGKILACRRGERQSQAGLWEFPGGKLNEGENASQALVREIKEELSVDIKIVCPNSHLSDRSDLCHQPLSPVVHKYPNITIELIPFTARIISGEPIPTEHSEIRWIEPKEASELKWAPADIPILEEYLRKCAAV